MYYSRTPLPKRAWDWQKIDHANGFECTKFEHAFGSESESDSNSTTVCDLGVSFSTTDPADVFGFRPRFLESCTIFDHLFRNRAEGA